jgi:tetratricopeptide (TPR) repeat protein
MSQQFFRCLNETGWLIVNANDGIQEFASNFVAARCAGSIAYQKKPRVRERQRQIPEPATIAHHEGPKINLILPEYLPVSEIEVPSDIKRELVVVKPAVKVIADQQDVLFIQSVARAYADEGSLYEALKWCDLAVAERRTDPDIHYLRATILQEQGALEEAASSLQTVLYLDPTFVLAHVTMAFVALQLKQRDVSEKYLENAKGLLTGYPPELVLPQAGGITAGRLVEMIQKTHNRKATQ